MRRQRLPRKLMKEDPPYERMHVHDWMVPYGDLMTLILIFFIFFFAFSRIGVIPNFEEILRIFQEKHIEPSEAIFTIKANELERKDAKGELILRIPSTVLFDSGKAELKQDALPVLDEIIVELQERLKNETAQIRVEGYTDSIPICSKQFQSNWELSAARAISVVKYFIEKANLPPEKLQAMGYGEYCPVAPNDTETGRQKNRRVEIKIAYYSKPEEVELSR